MTPAAARTSAAAPPISAMGRRRPRGAGRRPPAAGRAARPVPALPAATVFAYPAFSLMAVAQPAAYRGGIDGWAQSASRPACGGVNVGVGLAGAGGDPA